MSSGSQPPSGRQPPSSRDRLDATVEMDVREHLKNAPPTNSPPTLMSIQAGLQPLRAIRVAVRTTTGRQLEVLRLGDDEPAPQGAQEALLVPLPRR
jgi:hypothetical protein